VAPYELVGFLLLALAPPAEATPPPEEGSSPTTSAEAEKPAWALRVSAFSYFLPDQNAYVQPTVAVDHGRLHLEGRYNYEDRQTGSLWVGWNFEWGDKLTFSLTPMLGVVFGQINGIAPGLEWSLAWGPVEFSSENEVVIDLGDAEQSYFYAWSELSVRPFEWLRAGVALQRTRAHASPREVQWGPLIGVSVWKIEVTGYYFNPGQSDAQYGVVSVGLKL
jgi:hypothetical protein